MSIKPVISWDPEFVRIPNEEGRRLDLPTLYLSQPLTRRKTMHYIVDPDGVVVWRGQVAADAVDTLIDRGHDLFVVETDRSAFLCRLHFIKSKED